MRSLSVLVPMADKHFISTTNVSTGIFTQLYPVTLPIFQVLNTQTDRTWIALLELINWSTNITGFVPIIYTRGQSNALQLGSYAILGIGTDFVLCLWRLFFVP